LENEQGARAKLLNPQTRLGVGAIGKGWIVDQMSAFLKSRGYLHILINAGGDLMASGGPWEVAIQVPSGTPFEITKSEMIANRAMASSGQYEQKNHVMDPLSGSPVQEKKSVTVKAYNLTLADALATAFLVMGEEKSQLYLKKFPGIEMIWTEINGISRRYTAP
jgi:thiamine biosynthesis lipoprotein